MTIMIPSNCYESTAAERSSVTGMSSPVKRLGVVFIVAVLLAVPAMGMSAGPSSENGDGAVSYTHLTLPTILLV